MKKADAAKDNLDLLSQVAARLAASEVTSAYPEAEMLVRHFAKMDRVSFFAGSRPVAPAARRKIEKALSARIEGQAIQYVLKKAEFCGRSFLVTKDVLIPRQETEMLVDRALEIPARDILDIGTGSGCIAVCLTLERPDCRMTALDLSKKALAVARKNSNYHELGKRITFLHSDLFSAVRGRRFDMIVTNPPYIPAGEIAGLPREVRGEPLQALDGGAKGLDIIEKILTQAPGYLTPGGALLMEIGLGQSAPVEKILKRDTRYASFNFIQDLAGIHRLVEARVHG